MAWVLRAAPYDGADNSTACGHLPDHLVKAVGYVEIAGPVNRDRLRIIKFSARCRAPVSAVTTLTDASTISIACNRRNNSAACSDLSDHVIAKIGDVKISKAINGDSGGRKKRGGSCWATISAVVT
jgi:hypothetical protein